MPEKEFNGVRIYYETRGDDEKTPAVFFLNGVMASTGSWDLMLHDYIEAGFRVVLHDFRGQLKSEKPEKQWSLNDHADDLAALMDDLGIESASLIGTSYGGEVALHFAVRYPERCSSLVLIDSVSETGPLLRAAVESWITAAATRNGEAFYRLMLPWLYSSDYLKEHHDELQTRAAAMAKLPDDYFAGQEALYRSFLEIDISGRLEEIKAPALVICGEEDILKPPAFSELMAGEIPDSELLIIPNCGHVAIFEKPTELNRAILDFYSRRGLLPA